MAQGRGFVHCCTAREIGGFSNETQEEIGHLLDEGRQNGSLLTIATLSPNQMRNTAPMLEKTGFIKVGTYPGHAGEISLYVRGLTLVKGGQMSIKKTKKTVTLKTGKKIVKKVNKVR